MSDTFDITLTEGGAIKGKNCTVKSIVPIEGGNRITFEWEENDGTVLNHSMDVMDGIDKGKPLSIEASATIEQTTGTPQVDVINVGSDKKPIFDFSFSGIKGEKGDAGTDGKSTYEIAVENGFEGTEADWLASLKGDEGDKGKTAYQVAVDNGFEGTEQEWLDSLKGLGSISDEEWTQINTILS